MKFRSNLCGIQAISTPQYAQSCILILTLQTECLSVAIEVRIIQQREVNKWLLKVMNFQKILHEKIRK